MKVGEGRWAEYKAKASKIKLLASLVEGVEYHIRPSIEYGDVRYDEGWGQVERERSFDIDTMEPKRFKFHYKRPKSSTKEGDKCI